MIDIDNQIYLENIAERVTYYYEARQVGINFIVNNKIIDNNLIVEVLLITAIWSAYQRDEVLTDEEIAIFFGITPNSDFDEQHSTVELHPDHAYLTLNELLEMAIERPR